MGQMTVRLEGEDRVVVTRDFAALPTAVFRAHTDPAIMPLWLIGPDGWRMTRCDCDPRPGGTLRCDWTDAEGGQGFHLTGEYLEVEAPHRTLHVERMHLPDPTPDNRVETLFAENGQGGTRMTMTMTLPDAETRAAMLATGMEEGMAASYDRLDPVLAG